jgi:hypothetical protein
MSPNAMKTSTGASEGIYGANDVKNVPKFRLEMDKEVDTTGVYQCH